MTLREAMRSMTFYMLLAFVMLIGFTTSVLNHNVVPRLSDLGFDPSYAALILAFALLLLAAACHTVVKRIRSAG